MFNEDRGYWYPAIQIAAGILLAAAVMTALGLMFAAHQIRQAEQAIAQVAADIQARTEAAQAKQRAAAVAKAEQDRQRRLEQAEKARQTEKARREGVTQMEAKERAWDRYYQTPPECEKPADWDVQVGCDNEHIRARRDFELKW